MPAYSKNPLDMILGIQHEDVTCLNNTPIDYFDTLEESTLDNKLRTKPEA